MLRQALLYGISVCCCAALRASEGRDETGSGPHFVRCNRAPAGRKARLGSSTSCAPSTTTRAKGRAGLVLRLWRTTGRGPCRTSALRDYLEAERRYTAGQGGRYSLPDRSPFTGVWSATFAPDGSPILTTSEEYSDFGHLA